MKLPPYSGGGVPVATPSSQRSPPFVRISSHIEAVQGDGCYNMGTGRQDALGV